MSDDEEPWLCPVCNSYQDEDEEDDCVRCDLCDRTVCYGCIHSTDKAPDGIQWVWLCNTCIDESKQ
jgi:hypothetical protein